MKALALAAAMSLVPTLAHANDRDLLGTSPERDVGVYVLLGILALDTTFTVYNLATLGERKSDLYALGETVLTVPQTLLFGALASMADDDDAWIPATLAVWTAGIAAHGIYTLATDAESGGAAPRTVMFSLGSQF
ncbi:MAG: hypothetical protein H0T46_16755 [Deltaproteobacteria bacterium]|nr:hypothetical protein [Deltaproteobacteria bacterium]